MSWIARSRGNPQSAGLQRVAYPPYLDHSGGSGLGVTRSLHTKIGGFDESLPRLMDTDYCFRLQLAGAKTQFLHEAVVHVRWRDSLQSAFQQARLWGQYNVLLAKRYRPTDEPIKAWQAWTRYIRRSGHILYGFGKLRKKEDLAAWLRHLGRHIGILQGSVKFRSAPISEGGRKVALESIGTASTKSSSSG